MSRPIEHPPVKPIAERDAWSRTLADIASAPLEFCEDFPTIAKRYEAWWYQEVLDRPVFGASVRTDPARRITKRLELFDRPEVWYETKLADMKSLRLIGDELPNIRVDFGPVLLGGLLGGEVEFLSNTTWTHPLIDDDWLVPDGAGGSKAPDWTIDEDNPLWKLLLELTERVAEDAPGRYLIRTPDLGGSGDVLMNLRGASPLCMDVIDRPDVVRDAVNAIYPAWRRAFTELYRIAVGGGAGLIHWIGMWSSEPYMIPACDFNYLIGCEQFDDILLEDIARQSATAGRAVFHLDGEGATKHIDALLEIPEMRAIQYVPGAGRESAFPWIDMFRKIQAKGRSLVVQCPLEEVIEVAELLRPEGLMFKPYGTKDVDAVFETFCRKYGC